MDDWAQLTEEDLARAQRMARVAENAPEALVIREEDIPPGESVVRVEQPLTITLDDLRPVPPQHENSPDLLEMEWLMYNLINQARAAALPVWLGTTQLEWDERLTAVARGHAQDMLHRQYVAHVTPDGISAAQRLSHYGIRYVACGENIGVVYGEQSHSEQGVYEIHNAFMNQPRSLTNHRGNLLNPIWTHVGIGLAYNPDGALVATQNFISAPATRIRGR
jgi:uncharacterized protein YkwD